MSELEAVTTTDPNPPPVSPIAEMVKGETVSLKELRAIESGEKPAPEPKPAVEAKPAETDATDESAEEPGPAVAAADASEAGKQLAKKRKSLQDRINELTTEKHTHRMEAEEARLERDALKRRLEALETQKAEPAKADAATEDAEPQPDAFDTYEKYVKAQARWETRQELTAALAARDQADADRRGQRDFQAAVEKHATRVTAAKAKYADYDAVIAQGNTAVSQAGVTLPPAMLKAIIESDRSADLLYDLASHPEVCLQVARDAYGLPLTAAPLVRRVLESRLAPVTSGPDAQPKPVTKAAAPIKPLGSASVASPSVAELVKGTQLSLKQLRSLEGRH